MQPVFRSSYRPARAVNVPKWLRSLWYWF